MPRERLGRILEVLSASGDRHDALGLTCQACVEGFGVTGGRDVGSDRRGGTVERSRRVE